MVFKPPQMRTSVVVSKRVIRQYSASSDGSIPQSKQKYIPKSGTYPQGFKVGSAHVGVKPSNTRFDDLALVTSEIPSAAAAVFTRNRFQAAPVQVSRSILNKRHNQDITSVIANSGCANAVTGRGGLEDAHKMAQETDRCLDDLNSAQSDVDTPRSLVMSTGVIGQRLPIDKIISKIPTAAAALGNTHQHWVAAARAICTTDTFPKVATREFTLPDYPGQTFRMAGIAKGAGMIHPNMGTLLSVICTDAPAIPSLLHPLLAAAVDASFNSISIDGDTSTNDTVALLANGAAVSPSARAATPTDPTHPYYPALAAHLTALCTDLAQLLVRDAEGATKFVTLRIRPSPGAHTPADVAGARAIASAIARSPLVKTALYGADANWGRILAAVGYAEGVPDGVIDPGAVSLSFVQRGPSGELKEELELLVNGEPRVVDEARASRFLAEEDLEILVRLAMRTEEEAEYEEKDVLFWTCDLSHEYVTINGDYRT